MSRINPECPDSKTPDHSVAVNVLLRQEPDDDEEDEDNGRDKNNDEDDEENGDGYSE